LSRDEGGTLTYVSVGSFTKSSEIDALVQAQGGYKSAKVAFFDATRAEDNFITNMIKAIKDLQ
jgi:hypothetical protein